MGSRGRPPTPRADQLAQQADAAPRGHPLMATPFYTAPDPTPATPGPPGGPDMQAFSGPPTQPSSSAFNQTPPAQPQDMSNPAPADAFVSQANSGSAAQPKDMSNPADPDAFESSLPPVSAPTAPPADLAGVENIQPYKSQLTNAPLSGEAEL